MGEFLTLVATVTVAVGFCVAAQAQAQVKTVDVFTTQQIGHAPIAADNNEHVKIYFLGALNNLNSQLNTKIKRSENAGLSRTEVEKEAKIFFATHKSKYTAASTAVAKAYNLGVSQIPSIVINDKYQIVGTTNITLAQAKFKAWKEEHLDSELTS
jgi:integrating conjugative element protein (TIGR03757 family)